MLTAGLLLLLLLCRAGWSAQPDLHAWKWQRTVTLASPAVEQCVVLDADVYAHAAPGLRDVRLVQQGRPVAYALEESYDESAAAKPGSDRSQFTTVLQIPLSDSHSTDARSETQSGAAVLPRGVPVESMLLVPVQAATTLSVTHPNLQPPLHFRLIATSIHSDTSRNGTPQDVEDIEAVLSPESPRLLTAIGANLQSNATVSIVVRAHSELFSRVLLQMRQRSLCFQPLSSAPLLLLLGNAAARPVHYDYATQFHPTAAPLLARLGPVEPNTQYRNEQPHPSVVPTRLQTLVLVMALVVAAILLLVPALMKR